jgi:hypothetical protein
MAKAGTSEPRPLFLGGCGFCLLGMFCVSEMRVLCGP